MVGFNCRLDISEEKSSELMIHRLEKPPTE